MSMSYPHRKFLSKRVRVVVDALMDSFAEEPDLALSPDAVPTEWNA